MGNTTDIALKLEQLFNQFMSFHKDSVSGKRGEKSSSQKARGVTNEMGKLLKEYRKASLGKI
jgi:hypothetical protein